MPGVPPTDPNETKVRESLAQMRNIQFGITTYKIYTGFYPEKLEDLIHNPGIKGWKKCIDKVKIPKDAWDNDFVYQRTTNGYQIISYGVDGKPGGEGFDADIVEEIEWKK